MSDVVLMERSGGIATVTPNRPETLNALDQELAETLTDTLARLEHDPDVRVVVLRGAGRSFMAGGDVKAFHAAASLGPVEIRTTIESLIPVVHRGIQIIHRMPQPVIASVGGVAAGSWPTCSRPTRPCASAS